MQSYKKMVSLLVTVVMSLAAVFIAIPCRAQEPVFGPKTYTRTTAQVSSFTDMFATQASEGSLRISTGDEEGLHRVSSARITLNGVEIFSTSDFNQLIGRLEANVTFKNENTLTVNLYGAPGSYLVLEMSGAFEEEVPGWRMPELALDELNLYPLLADPGEPITIVVGVKNIGAGVTSQATMRLEVDGNPLCNEDVDPLEPDAGVEFECSWTASGPGRHLVRAELELPDGAFDGSITNNTSIGLIRVSGETNPQPEIELNGADFDSLAFNAGESYLLPIKVRNASFVDLNNLLVQYFVDGALTCPPPVGPMLPVVAGDVFPPPTVCFDTIEHLGPGEQVQLSFPWSNATAGEHMVSMQVIDPNAETPVLKVQGWIVAVPDQTVLYETPGVGQWASLGPKILDNDWTGRISSVAFDPNNPLTVYASASGKNMGIYAAAGVWKSTDGGSQWQPVGDRLASMRIRRVAVDPNHTSILYASGPDGIFKSINGGVNWSHFAASTITPDARLYIGATASGDVLIYAGTDQGLKRYISADPWQTSSGFADWDVIKSGKIGELAVHPNDSSTVYIAVAKAIYRTTEATTIDPKKADTYWTKLTVGLPPYLSSVSLNIHDKFPERIYAGIASPDMGIAFGIYRSDDDGGDTWLNVVSYAPDDLEGALYNPFIRVVPLASKDLEIIYFGGVKLYEFIDIHLPGITIPGLQTKRTYKVLPGGHSADMKDLEFMPGLEDTFYWVGNDQGIFQCRIEVTPSVLQVKGLVYGISGDICIKRNLDLRVAEVYDIDVSVLNPNRIIGGTQDTGTILYEGDLIWKQVKSGDGLYSLFNTNDDSIMYAQHQAFNDDHGTERSDDDGEHWSHVAKGMPEGYGLGAAYITSAPDYADILIARGDGKAIYFHTNPSAFPSVPWGSYPVDTAAYGPVNYILPDMVVPGTGSWWLTGTGKGKIIIPWLQGSTLGFKTVYTHPFVLGVKTIAISPVDPRIIYATFAANNKISIQRIALNTSDPELSTSTDITYNFPSNLLPLSLCADPEKLDVVYIGTEKGVMRLDPSSTNSFTAWQPFNDGLPLTAVLDLVSSPADGSVVAATMGRGVWRVLSGP